jgi:hypothetical protein
MSPDNTGWMKRVKQTSSFDEMAIVLREWLAAIKAMKIDHVNKPK